MSTIPDLPTSEHKPLSDASTLVRNLESEIAAIESQLRRQRGTFQFWHLILASSVTFLLLVMAAMYAHQRDFIRFSDSSTVASVTPPASAASQPPAINVPAEKKGGDFRDLLTILVPTFAVAVAFMVGAAGMRRLETYDEEFARARKERREDAADLRSQLEKAQLQFADQVKVTLGAQVQELVQKQVGDVKSLLGEQTTIAKQNLELAISASREAAQKSAESAAAIAERLERDFSLIKASSSTAEMLSLPVIAVGRIESEIEALFSAGKDGLAVNMICACLAQAERIHGEANDWFNVSAELGRRDQEALALQVCLTGLHRCFGGLKSPSSENSSLARQDLIAHAISYATKTGNWEEAARLVGQAETIGRSRWGWRLFTFVGDYFEYLGDEDQYNELNRDFAKFHPCDERAYSQPASRLERLGRLDEAAVNIRTGLNQKHIRGQQLCGIYTTLLLDQGRYSETIEVATKGLANLADAQPSTATYALVFRRAAAYDALAIESLYKTPNATPDGALNLVRQAVYGYKATLEFGQTASGAYRRQAEARINLLASLFGMKANSPQQEQDDS